MGTILLKHDLVTNNHTEVHYEEEFEGNAPCHFVVTTTDEKAKILSSIHFQEGPVNENGVNGVMNEDLIAIVIKRLEYFNQSEFRCRENSMAITKLEESLMWLRKRTMGREQRGVIGTSEK